MKSLPSGIDSVVMENLETREGEKMTANNISN